MLIIFLGSHSEQLCRYFSDNEGQLDTPVIVAQAGVYELVNILRELPQAKLFVIQRDLEAAGLVSTFRNNTNVTMIDFDAFVALTTQYSPCITVQ